MSLPSGEHAHRRTPWRGIPSDQTNTVRSAACRQEAAHDIGLVSCVRLSTPSAQSRSQCAGPSLCIQTGTWLRSLCTAITTTF